MPGKETGTVTAWNMARPGKKHAEGYGFVAVDGREESKTNNLFLYADNIKDSRLRSEAKIFGLKQGARISFNIKEPASSRQSCLAVDVEPMRGESGSHGGGSHRERSRSRRRSPACRRERSRSRRRSTSARRRRSPTPRRSPSPKGRRSPSARREKSVSQKRLKSRSPRRRSRSRSDS